MNIVFWGKVRQGKKRGKELGFPTANIFLHRKISDGIYISRVKLDGKTYRALTFIGSAKTFGEKDIKAETYIFSFNSNIYGEWITVTLLKKIRGNQKFISSKELIKQMENDRQIAQKYFTMCKDV